MIRSRDKKSTVSIKYVHVLHLWVISVRAMANKRSFETFWKPFLYIFKLLCISHVKSLKFGSRAKKKIHKLFGIYFLFNSVIIIIAIIVSVYKIIQMVTEDTKAKYQDNPMFYYVDSIGFFGNFIALCITHFETIFKRSEEKEILNIMFQTNNCLVNQLNCKVNYERIKWKYWCKMSGFFLFTLVVSIISTSIGFPVEVVSRKLMYNVVMVIALIIVRARTFQITLFISILGEILSDLNAAMKERWEMIKLKKNFHSLEEDLFNFREIYSNSWLIKTSISNCFGWSLIAIILQSIIDIIIAVYWMFVNLDTINSSMLMYCA